MRGYSNYRGRRMPLGKKLAIIVMVLILLLSSAYLLLSRYTAYDSEGHHFFDLPWRQEQSGGDGEPDDVSLIRQEPPDPLDEMHAVELSVSEWRQRAADGDWWRESGDNALILRLKEADGLLHFASETAEGERIAADALTREEIQTLTDSGIYTAAKLSCFRDSAAAFADMTGMGLCQSSGYIWYDEQSGHWLDPGKEAAQDYLLGLIDELEELGFDEIVLEDVGYPTEGRLHKAAPTEADHEDRVAAFLQAAKSLKEKKVRLSLALEEETLLGGGDETAGLDLTAVMDGIARVYVRTAEADAAEEALRQLSESAVLVRCDAEEGPRCRILP